MVEKRRFVGNRTTSPLISVQTVPLCALLDFPTIHLSTDSIDFGSCYVGQTRTVAVDLRSLGASTSWKSHMGNQRLWSLLRSLIWAQLGCTSCNYLLLQYQGVTVIMYTWPVSLFPRAEGRCLTHLLYYHTFGGFPKPVSYYERISHQYLPSVFTAIIMVPRLLTQ